MITMTVRDMTCGHCASRITRALKDLDPTATVDIALGEKTVRVETSVEPADVLACIVDAGYTPRAAA